MKVTLDISGPLLRAARLLAIREGTTVDTLIERGLRRVVAESRQTKGFRLRKASLKGRGLRPDFANAGWDRFRAAVYGFGPD